MNNILVLGATGTMGQRIVRLLTTELPDAEVLGASRHPDQHAALPMRRLDYRDPATYAAALDDVAILIHAAGPYDHDPTALVSYCLTAGVHYIDLAEDYRYIARVLACANSTAPLNSSIATGFSTVPALVYALVREFDALPGLSSLDVYLSMGSKNPVGEGLLYSLLRPLGQVNPHGERWFRRSLSMSHLDGTQGRYAPYPFPAATDTMPPPLAIPLRFHVGFDRPLLVAALHHASQAIWRLSDTHLRTLSRALLPMMKLAQIGGTYKGRLTLIARNDTGAPLAQLELTADENGLDIPAAPSLWASRYLLKQPDSAGIVTLADVISKADIIAWLRAHGYGYTRRDLTDRQE